MAEEEHDPYEDSNVAESQKRMRRVSGRVNSNRKLVSFLYLLGRDELALGRIESLWMKNLNPETGRTESSLFTNGWLAQWAIDMADRLEGLDDEPNSLTFGTSLADDEEDEDG